MTDAGDPRGGSPDRGFYGAGWSQPAPPGPGPSAAGSSAPGSSTGAAWPGQAGGQPPYGRPLPYGQTQPGSQRPGRRDGDPRRAFAPGASVANTTGALIAVVSVVVVEFVSGVLGLLGTSLVVHPFSTYGTGASLLGSFVSGVFASPFPFHAGAFLALAFLTPIARRSPLPTVLLRAVLAGAAGTVALALVGVFTGSWAAVRTGSGARLVIDVVTTPLQDGVPFTLMLLATSTVAWLWLGRPRGGRAAHQHGAGRPGSVRPADAVPPSTVQPPQGPSAPQHVGPPSGGVQQPYGQQQQPGRQQPGPQQPGPQQPGAQHPGQRPDDHWAPPAAR